MVLSFPVSSNTPYSVHAQSNCSNRPGTFSNTRWSNPWPWRTRLRGACPRPSASTKSSCASRCYSGTEMQQIWLQSHAALGALYERVARPDDARRLYSALVEQWKDGDSDLVLLKTVRERLSKLSPQVNPPKP